MILRQVIALVILSLTSTSYAYAGWLSKAIIGTAVVGAYSAGKSQANVYNTGPTLLEDVQSPKINNSYVTNNEAQSNRMKGMKGMKKALWKTLVKKDFDNAIIPTFAGKLSETDNLSMLDTSAFAYAELGEIEKALAIYQQKIVPILKAPGTEIDTIDKYDRHYEILSSCTPKTCVETLGTDR